MTHCKQQIKWDEINIQEDVQICWHCNFYNVVEKLLSKRFRIESMILTEKRLGNLMKFIIYVFDILDFWKFLCEGSIIFSDNQNHKFSMVHINTTHQSKYNSYWYCLMNKSLYSLLFRASTTRLAYYLGGIAQW